jgi:hypothetical protein
MRDLLLAVRADEVRRVCGVCEGGGGQRTGLPACRLSPGRSLP